MYVCVCVCVCVCIIINIKVYYKKFPQFKTNYSWFQNLVSIKRKKKNRKLKSYHCILRKQIIQISYHSTLTKIQKLQNLKKKKKKKKTFFSTGRYCPKLTGTANIFSSTKQRGYMYQFVCRYGTESTPLSKMAMEAQNNDKDIQSPNNTLPPISNNLGCFEAPLFVRWGIYDRTSCIHSDLGKF